MKAIFFNPDRILIEDVAYTTDSSGVHIKNEIGEALKFLKCKGYKIIVVTSLPLTSPDFSDQGIERLSCGISQLFEHYQVELDGFYFSSQADHDKSALSVVKGGYKKSSSELIKKAAHTLQIDLSKSWIIADILDDIESGNSAGCHAILIDNGYEDEWIFSGQRMPTYIVEDIKEAVEKVTSHEEELIGIPVLI